MRKPHPVPLDANLDARDLTASTLLLAKDARLINGCYVPSLKSYSKRYGFAPSITTTGVGAGWGAFYTDFGGVYSITADGKIFRGTSNLATLDTSAGHYWFELVGLSYVTPNVQYLYFSNGIKGYYIRSDLPNTVTTIADVNYPTQPTVWGSAYLNATLYVMDQNASIWGSKNLNDPSVWSATNLVKAQSSPGLAIAIARHNSYVVAFKKSSIEFFYDAGSYAGTATGSALLPRQDLKIGIGCLSGTTLISISDTLFFIGASRDNDPQVYRIDNAQVQKISTDAVARVLREQSPYFGTVYAWQSRQHGSSFYCLNLTAIGITLAYQVDADKWWVWTENGSNIDVTASWSASTDSNEYTQSLSSGKNLRLANAYTMTDTAANGTVYPLTFDLVTDKFDGGTTLKKVLTKLRAFVANSDGGMFQLRWSDDDYVTWSPWITCSNLDPVVEFVNLGTFRRRAFQIRCTSPTQFRISRLEAELLIGAV